MTDEPNWLLVSRLDAVLAGLAGADPARAEALWREADRAVAEAGAGEEADVALPVLERSAAELAGLLERWRARKTPLSAWDQAVLKRAMKALKRRIELTRADDDVSSSRNPLTKGASSSITGVRPPERYPADIWALLVVLGRVRDAGDGVLEPTGV